MTRDDPGETLTFHRAPALPGVEAMSAYGSLQGWHVFHERYALCACRTAFAGWIYRHGSYQLEDRTIMLLEPGEVHRNTRVDKRSDFKVVFVDAARLKAAARARGLRGTPHFVAAQTQDAALFDATYALCEAMEGAATELEQESRMEAWLQRVMRFTEEVPAHPRGHDSALVARARDYIVSNYNKPITLSELAAVAHLTPFHLLRAFSKRYGFPPHAFLVHVRVERAATLLRAGFLPVDVAATVGFADQSHLARHFKRIFRVTPATYARPPRTAAA